jgi:N-acetylneuraminic acid mutarotase
VKKIYCLLSCVLFLVLSCQKDKPNVATPIEISINVGIQDHGVRLSGDLRNIALTDIEKVGFVWSKTPEPVVDRPGVLTFSNRNAALHYGYEINAGLAEDSTYYARAFYLDKNKAYHYSKQVSFKSNGSQQQALSSLNYPVSWGEEVVLNMEVPITDDVSKVTIQINDDVALHPKRIADNRVYFDVPNSLNTRNNLLNINFDGVQSNYIGMWLANPEISPNGRTTLHESETLIISGNYFHPELSKNIVTIGSKPLQVLSGTPTQLTVKVNNLALSEAGVLTVRTGIDLSVTSNDNYGLYKYLKVMSNFPGVERREGISLVMGGYFYYGLGWGKESGAGLGDWWRYDPDRDEWKKLKEYPKDSRIVNAFAINNKAYVGMGIMGDDYSKTFYCYDPAKDSWTAVAPFGGAMTRSSLAFSSAKYGYIVGGDSGRRVNEVWRYDPGQNTWKRIGDCPGVARMMAMGFQIGNKQYMAGGSAYPISDQDVFEFDLNSETWRQVADLPYEMGVTHGFTFSLNGKGYIGGGVITGDSRCSSLLFEYDPLANTWTKKEQIIDPIYYGASAGSIGNTAFIVCGAPSYGYHLGTKKFLQFKP